MKLTRTLSCLLPIGALFVAGCGQTPATVRVEPKNSQLDRKGQTKSLAATVLDAKGETIANAQVQWSSNNAKVASVDASGAVKAESTGVATITAASAEATGQAIVTVLIPSKIEIEPAEALLRGPGTTLQLSIRIYDEKAQLIPGAKLEWSSDNPAVVTVADGVLTAVADGAARVSVKASDAVGTVNVTVRGPQPTAIRVEPSPVVLKRGATQQLSAAVTDDLGQPMPDALLTWASADPAIATVDASGLVAGVKPGNTMITVTAGAVTQPVETKIR